MKEIFVYVDLERRKECGWWVESGDMAEVGGEGDMACYLYSPYGEEE